MPKFKLIVPYTGLLTYIMEATNEQEARDAIINGEADEFLVNCNEYLDDDWDVTQIDTVEE